MTMPTGSLQSSLITNPASLLELYAISQDDLSRIRAIGEILQPRFAEMTDGLCAWLERQPEYEVFFSNARLTNRIKQLHVDYWRAFFAGTVDGNYLNSRRLFGRTHALIGLPSTSYVAGTTKFLGIIGETLREQVTDKDQRIAGKRAVVRLLHLDVGIVVEIHTQIEKAARALGRLDPRDALLEGEIERTQTTAERKRHDALTDEIHAKNLELQTRVEEQAAQLQGTVEQATAERNSHERLRNELHAKNLELQTRVEEQAAQLRGTVEQATAERNSHEGLRNELHAKNLELQTRVEEQAAQLQGTVDQATAERQSHGELINELHAKNLELQTRAEEQAAQLQGTVDQATAERQSHGELINELHAKNLELQTSVEEQAAQLRGAVEQATAEQKSHEELRNEIQGTKLELERYRTRVDKQAAQLQDMAKQVIAERKSLGELTDEIQGKKLELERYQTRVDEQAAQLKEAATQATADRRGHRKLTDEIQGENLELRTRIEEQAAQLRKTEKQATAERESHEELRDEIRNKNLELRTRVEEQAARLKEMEERATAERKSHEELKDEVQDKKLELEIYRTRVDEQAAQLTEAATRATADRRSHGELTEEIRGENLELLTRMEEQAALLRETVTQAAAERDGHEELRDEIRDKNLELRTRVEEQAARMKEMTEQAAAERRSHEELRDEIQAKNVELRARMEALAAQLEDAVKQLNATSEASTQFLANMSHELRAPMTTILGYTEKLIAQAEDLGDDPSVHDLQKIHTAGKHLLNVIDDVLDLTTIEAGEMELSSETFELNPMLDELAATVAALVHKNNNTLELQRSAELGSMHADLTKIRRSLLNLLSNAGTFTENGTITLTARRETAGDGDWIEFRIEDTGIGVHEDQLDRLFVEFMQADASTTRQYGGVGAGLAITKRFCEMMGGSITAKSEVGKGTTITIKLPAAAESSAVPVERAPEPEIEPPAVTPRRVLVINEDGEERASMMSALEADGFAATSAGTAKEGLDLARRLKPSLITLDVALPDEDGWAVLATIKADPELRHTPVIMVSFRGDKRLACFLGAVDALPKPANRKMLRRAVNKYIRSDGRKRALVVEDDQVSRSLMRASLEEDGWEVDEAENGAVALGRLAERTPDVILLDLMMPVMDGFEFSVQLRQRVEYRSIPVIVVTAKELTPEDRQRLSGAAERVVEKGSISLKEFLGQANELVSTQHGDEGWLKRLVSKIR